MIEDRDAPEDVGGQALLSVLLLQGLLPEGRGELEDATSGPGRQEAEEVAEVGPGLAAPLAPADLASPGLSRRSKTPGAGSEVGPPNYSRWVNF